MESLVSGAADDATTGSSVRTPATTTCQRPLPAYRKPLASSNSRFHAHGGGGGGAGVGAGAGLSKARRTNTPLHTGGSHTTPAASTEASRPIIHQARAMPPNSAISCKRTNDHVANFLSSSRGAAPKQVEVASHHVHAKRSNLDLLALFNPPRQRSSSNSQQTGLMATRPPPAALQPTGKDALPSSSSGSEDDTEVARRVSELVGKAKTKQRCIPAVQCSPERGRHLQTANDAPFTIPASAQAWPKQAASATVSRPRDARGAHCVHAVDTDSDDDEVIQLGARSSNFASGAASNPVTCNTVVSVSVVSVSAPPRFLTGGGSGKRPRLAHQPSGGIPTARQPLHRAVGHRAQGVAAAVSFPSEVEFSKTIKTQRPGRTCVIASVFSNAAAYKKTLVAAINEQITCQLFDVGESCLLPGACSACPPRDA